MKQKEQQEKLLASLKEWQQIESRTIAHSAQVMSKTNNPLVQIVMELIQRDSAFHRRIQQFVIDSFEKEPVSLATDDLVDIWDLIEEHINIEKEVAGLSKQLTKSLAGTKNVVQHYLLEYLADDEEKHDRLLENLKKLKEGIYRTA